MAKYTQAEVDELGKKGHAFGPDEDGHYSYPIDDVEDLKNAIHAVGRGKADHDKIRKYIIGRAKALGQSDLIPENWNADGSLSDEAKAAMWDANRRADQPTYSDLCSLLDSAVASKWGGGDDDWTYVKDFSDEWVVFCLNGEVFQAPYSVDGAVVTLGKKVPVRTVTTYEPVEANSGRPRGTRLPAVPKRAFASLVEQPPARVAELQIRMGDPDNPNTAQFRGYASVTGEYYNVHDWLGEYREKINPGAFAKTLREQLSIPLLFNHDGMPLANTAAETLRLSEDSRGLLTEALLDRRQALTNDLCIALERRDVSKMSFSFRAIKDEWNDAYDERSVSELALYDTSIVTYPANPATTAELRGAIRSVLGREGVSLMWSARAALEAARHSRINDAAEPVFEGALRALCTADEAMCRQHGAHGRARTFLVASLMMQVREGRVLSAANEKLLRDALAALHEADDHLTGIDAALDEGQAALSSVLNVANPDGDPNDPDDNGAPGGSNSSGLDGDAGGGASGKNPISPPDGAGPRGAEPASVAQTRRLVEQLRRPGGKKG